MEKFTCLGSSVSSTQKDFDIRLAKTWTAIDRLSVIWKSDQAAQFFPSTGRVDAAKWMHYMDAK